MKIPTNMWFDQYDCDDDNIEYQNIEFYLEVDIEPDFSEYLWMENMEEFDKNELQRLQDEETMQECYEAMQEDEQADRLSEQLQRMSDEGMIIAPFDIDADPEAIKTYLIARINDLIKMDDMCQLLSKICVVNTNVEQSTLNPLAAEFVPGIHKCPELVN